MYICIYVQSHSSKPIKNHGPELCSRLFHWLVGMSTEFWFCTKLGQTPNQQGISQESLFLLIAHNGSREAQPWIDEAVYLATWSPLKHRYLLPSLANLLSLMLTAATCQRLPPITRVCLLTSTTFCNLTHTHTHMHVWFLGLVQH